MRLPLPVEAALAVVPRTVGVHRPDGPDATVVEIGGGDLDGMVRYLAGLAVPLEVLGPPELRAAVTVHAEALAAANRAR